MYLKKKKEANGDIYLSVMEKYYDSKNKTTRERTVQGIGHVSQLSRDYDDPIAHYTRYAQELILLTIILNAQSMELRNLQYLSKMSICSSSFVVV